MLILNPSRYKREGTEEELASTELKTEEFECFAYAFIRTPSPFGYSLLSKRESFSLSVRICNADVLSISIYNAII